MPKPLDVFCLGDTWVEAADFWPYGEAETRVEIGLDDLTLGLHITRPFGPESDAMLLVHATEEKGKPGGEITLSIGTLMQRNKPAMDMSLLHSNPRRVVEDEDVA